jgi:hypothetical protein
VAQLQTMGALTALRRNTMAMAPVQTIPTPLHGFPAAGSPAGHTLPGVGSVAAAAPAPGLAPLGGGVGGFRGLGGPASGSGAPSLRPLGNLRPEPVALPAPVPRPAPVEPPPAHDQALSVDMPSSISSFGLAETPRGAQGQNLFSVPEEADQALELDIKPPKGGNQSDDPSPHPSHSLAGASALNTSKITNTSSASGLSTRAEDGQEDTVRCPTHGLLYDRRKNAGCRRCLEAKRSATRGATGERVTSSRRATPARATWVSNLSPARRAFLGLFLAMGLGFGGAAYYSYGPVATIVDRLRAEQTALSGRPGTQENLARFDQIDADVDRARSRGVRNSLILWVAASGVLLAGWYRATS